MKHRLSYFFQALAICLLLILGIIPKPSASALPAQEVQALEKYCDNNYSGHVSGLGLDCAHGYELGYATNNGVDEDIKTACYPPTQGGQYNATPSGGVHACRDGYTAGAKGTKPTHSGAILNQEISQACGYAENDDNTFNSCKQGFVGQKGNKSQDEACKGASDQEACIKAWAAAGGRVDPCEDFKGNEHEACVAGYAAASSNGSESVCNKYSGNAKQTCKDTFEQGGKDATPNPDPPKTNDQTPTCENGFSLSWILCSVITGLADTIDGMFKNLIQPLLITQTINVHDPSGDKTHTFQIWSNFRIYGNIFLIITLLVVVFGESISGGLIDAYTAKKILPRLIVGAVLINLSIYIVAVALDVTNIVGRGVSDLITAPFQDIKGGFDLHISGTAAGLTTASIVVGGIWGAVASGGFIHFLFIGILLPALLVFLAIFITVIVRQGLILFLVFISPVAFALYCLPNTEQYFKKWWDLLFRTLLVYPIISVIFAMANVLSVTINDTANGPLGAFTQVVSMGALFAPLFLVPLAFRLAGGVIGQLHNAASQRMAPARDKLEKSREANKQQVRQETMAGQRWKWINRYDAGRKLNRGVARMSRPDSFLPGFLGAGGKGALSTAVSAQTAQGAKRLQELGLQDDSSLNEFAQHYNNVGGRISELRNTSGKSNKQINADSAMADQLVAFRQFGGDRGMALGAMKLAASFGKLDDGSLEKMDDMYGSSPMESAAKQAAHGDLIFTSKNAGNFSTYASRLDPATGKVLTMHNDRENRMEKMAESLLDAGPQQLSAIKPHTDRTSGETVQDLTAEAVARGVTVAKPEQMSRALEQLAMQRTTGGYNTPVMKAAFDKAVINLNDAQRADLTQIEARIRQSEDERRKRLEGGGGASTDI